MGKRMQKWDEPTFDLMNELIFLCGSFLLGAVLGSFFAAGFSENGLFHRLTMKGMSIRSFLWLHGSLTLTLFFSAFWPFGRMTAPFTIAVEGFLMESAITCYIGQYGAKGYWPALAAWWMTGMMLVALQLLLGCRAAAYAKTRTGIRGRGGFVRQTTDRSYWLCGAVVLVMLLPISWLHCRWLADLAAFLLGKVQ